VLGADTVAQSILPILTDLAVDKRWRVRLQVLELMPTFAKQLGPDFFTTHFQAIYLKFVSDGVYSIREALLAGVRDVASVLGASWVEANFLGALLELQEHESYLLRITAIQAVSVLNSLLTPEVQRAAFLPLLKGLVSDRVPNVRMNAAKVLPCLIRTLRDPSSQELLRSLLASLQEDTDIDVRQRAEVSSHEL